MWRLARTFRHGVGRHTSISYIPCSALLAIVTKHGHLQPPSYYDISKRTLATTVKTATHYYDILELTPKASQKQIKSAYYRLSKIYHPDVNPSTNAHKKFAEISEAYEILGNLAKKRSYDRGLHQPFDHRAAGEDMTEEYFRRRSEQFRGRQAPPTGRTAQFDFDEFYRQHYAEQIQYQQMMKERERRHRQYMEDLKRQRAFVRSALWTMIIFGITISLLDTAVQESRRRP